MAWNNQYHQEHNKQNYVTDDPLARNNQSHQRYNTQSYVTDDPLAQFDLWRQPIHVLETIITECRIGEAEVGGLSTSSLDAIARHVECNTRMDQYTLRTKDMRNIYLWLKTNRYDSRNPYEGLKCAIDKYKGRTQGDLTPFIPRPGDRSLTHIEEIVGDKAMYAQKLERGSHTARKWEACIRKTVHNIANGDPDRVHTHDGRCTQRTSVSSRGHQERHRGSRASSHSNSGSHSRQRTFRPSRSHQGSYRASRAASRSFGGSHSRHHSRTSRPLSTNNSRRSNYGSSGYPTYPTNGTSNSGWSPWPDGYYPTTYDSTGRSSSGGRNGYGYAPPQYAQDRYDYGSSSRQARRHSRGY